MKPREIVAPAYCASLGRDTGHPGNGEGKSWEDEKLNWRDDTGAGEQGGEKSSEKSEKLQESNGGTDQSDARHLQSSSELNVSERESRARWSTM